MNTPDTLNTMIAGYIAFGVVLGAYLVSLFVRLRRARRALQERESQV